jgi:alkylmercury lyase-like protein
MLTAHKTRDELADAIATALGDPGPAGQRLAITLYRLLAAGRPVAPAALAAATGLPGPAVAETLSRWPAVFTDRQGRVTGVLGPGDRRAVPGAPVPVRRAGPVRLVRLGHPLPARQARGGGARNLGLSGHG